MDRLKTASNTAGIRAIRIISTIVDHAAVIILLLLLVYGTYSMWDGKQIYSEAQATQYEQYRPERDNSQSFDELRNKNKDVFAWLSVYGTMIDYPVAQGKDNQEYINLDIMRKYSLAGSIYLDHRNSKDFSDFNSIIYGHHMEEEAMFGDLDKFVDKEFFDARRYGNLFFDGEDHGIEFFAYVLADAYDWTLYSPAIQGSREDRANYLSYLYDIAEYTRDIGVDPDDRIVLLSTCAAEPTNGRHILIGRLSDEVYTNDFQVEPEEGASIRIDSQSIKEWAEKMPLWGWIVILLIIILILIILILIETLHNKKRVNRDRGSGNNGD